MNKIYEGKTILIVDDSALERTHLISMLDGLGFLIYEADSGESAIKVAKNHIPDLILMDVIMNGINGYQATKQIKNNEEFKNTVIILCTSKDQDIDKFWGERQGAKAHINKPISKQILLEQIKRILN